MKAACCIPTLTTHPRGDLRGTQTRFYPHSCSGVLFRTGGFIIFYWPMRLDKGKEVKCI